MTTKEKIEELQNEARTGRDFGFIMDQVDPDNKISGEAIDAIIKWTVENYEAYEPY